jgi:hypothetical protein
MTLSFDSLIIQFYHSIKSLSCFLFKKSRKSEHEIESKIVDSTYLGFSARKDKREKQLTHYFEF